MYKIAGTTLKNNVLLKQTCYLLLGVCALALSGCMSSINRTLSHIEAEESYYKGDFTRSFRLTEAMAYQGDKKSEYTLGYMYYYGIGAPENKPLGVAWMMEAARKGYPPAVVALNVIQGKSVVIETDIRPGPFCKNEKPATSLDLGIATPNVIEPKLIELPANPPTPTYGEAISYIPPLVTNVSQTVPAQKTVVASIPDEVVMILPTIPNMAVSNATPENHWTIQLATFSVKENAMKLVKKLKQANYPVFSEDSTRKGKTYTLVFAGPFFEKQDAIRLSQTFKTEYGMAGNIKTKVQANTPVLYASILSSQS